MTPMQSFRFKLYTIFYIILSIIGGDNYPLDWNVYGQGIAVAFLPLLIRHNYVMYKKERAQAGNE